MLLRMISSLVFISLLSISCGSSETESQQNFSSRFGSKEWKINNISIPKNGYSGMNHLRNKLYEIFEEETHAIEEHIMKIRGAANRGLKGKQLYATRNCGPASHAFQRILLKYKFDAKVEGTRAHQYVLVNVLVGGKNKEVIIDLTYRQFFMRQAEEILKSNNERLSMSNITNEILSFNIEPILISELKNLEENLMKNAKKVPGFTPATLPQNSLINRFYK